MKVETFTEFLTKHANARKEGHAFIVPSDVEATIYVGFEGETLGMARVTRVELDGTTVVADTAKGERYLVAVEDVRAMKIDRNAAERSTRGAGFGK